MTIYRQQIAAQQVRRSQLENQAREAKSVHTMVSEGVGELIEPEPFEFPNPFIFKPSISYGSEVVILPDQELWKLPRINGSVMSWKLDDRNFYIGAYVYVTVDLDAVVGASPVEQPEIQVDHHFVFSSLSYKTLGESAIAQVQGAGIQPRTVNL